jgi:hypothetical protein
MSQVLIQNPFNVLQYELTGECNRCGDCCRLTIQNELYECENLIVGEKETTCAIYSKRIKTNEVSLVNSKGGRIGVTCLISGSPIETLAIVNRIRDGRKCSYQVSEKQDSHNYTF